MNADQDFRKKQSTNYGKVCFGFKPCIFYTIYENQTVNVPSNHKIMENFGLVTHCMKP